MKPVVFYASMEVLKRGSLYKLTARDLGQNQQRLYGVTQSASRHIRISSAGYGKLLA